MSSPARGHWNRKFGDSSSALHPVQRALRGAFTLRDKDPPTFDMNNASYELYVQYFASHVLPVYPIISPQALWEIFFSQGGPAATYETALYCLAVALGASQYALDSNSPQRIMGIAISGHQMAAHLLSMTDLPARSVFSEARARLLMVIWCKLSGEAGTARLNLPDPDKLHSAWCSTSGYCMHEDEEHSLVCRLGDSEIAIIFITVQLSWEFSSTPSFYHTLQSTRQLRLSGDFPDKVMCNLLARCAVLRYISRVKTCWETWRPGTPGPAEVEDQMTDFFGQDWLPKGLSTSDLLMDGGASQNLTLPLQLCLERAQNAKATQERRVAKGKAPARAPTDDDDDCFIDGTNISNLVDETEIKRLKALFYFALMSTYSPNLHSGQIQGLGYYFVNSVDALICYCGILESLSVHERFLLSNIQLDNFEILLFLYDHSGVYINPTLVRERLEQLSELVQEIRRLLGRPVTIARPLIRSKSPETITRELGQRNTAICEASFYFQYRGMDGKGRRPQGSASGATALKGKK